MGVTQAIVGCLAGMGAEVKSQDDRGEARLVLAEKKSFLSKKRVEYQAKFRVDEHERAVRFFEMLKESGSGMAGGDLDDVGGGFGFKKESYKTGGGGREGTLEAQGSLLSQTYSFTFDYGWTRSAIEAISAHHGYRFEYQLTPKGL
jgi:hypothetical protein